MWHESRLEKISSPRYPSGGFGSHPALGKQCTTCLAAHSPLRNGSVLVTQKLVMLVLLLHRRVYSVWENTITSLVRHYLSIYVCIYLSDAWSFEVFPRNCHGRKVSIYSCPYIPSLHALILSFSFLPFFSRTLALCLPISFRVFHLHLPPQP